MPTTLSVDILVLGGGAGVMAALRAWQRDPTLRIATAPRGPWPTAAAPVLP
ncbi:MAG: hypothetical protein HY683_01595 [Chloroflexi bacterium]|nr:hypothetical protein [Chloroflexota bacterium]